MIVRICATHCWRRCTHPTVRTQGKGGVSATKAVETQGKSNVLATKAVETQGKSNVLATKAVETQGKGNVLVTKAVETQGKGNVFSHEGSANASASDSIAHQLGHASPDVSSGRREPAKSFAAETLRSAGGNGWWKRLFPSALGLKRASPPPPPPAAASSSASFRHLPSASASSRRRLFLRPPPPLLQPPATIPQGRRKAVPKAGRRDGHLRGSEKPAEGQ